MLPCLTEVYGNASSIHYQGQLAKQRMEEARRRVAALLHCSPKEIVFTSGGTEADNLAVFGTADSARHAIVSAIEHPAILNAAAKLSDVTYLQPDSKGVIHPDVLEKAMRPDTGFVSIMHVNNELGTIQPIAELAAVAHRNGAIFHSDGVQAAGRIPVDVEALGVDLYSVSAHKMYAPKGVGALYVRKGVELHPRAFGGRHESGRRAGTENVPGIVAFGTAAQRAPDGAKLASLRDRLEDGILATVPGTYVNAAGALRTPNTTNIRFDGIEGESMVIALDLRGFCVSSGAACSSGAVEPSPALLAIGLTREQAKSCIRFSLGQSNTEDQVDQLIAAVADSAAHLRKLSPTYV